MMPCEFYQPPEVPPTLGSLHQKLLVARIKRIPTTLNINIPKLWYAGDRGSMQDFRFSYHVQCTEPLVFDGRENKVDLGYYGITIISLHYAWTRPLSGYTLLSSGKI